MILLHSNTTTTTVTENDSDDDDDDDVGTMLRRFCCCVGGGGVGGVGVELVDDLIGGLSGDLIVVQLVQQSVAVSLLVACLFV